MKFNLQTITQCTGRLGLIAEFERLPGLLLETPALMLNTKGAVIPHLTYETLQMVTSERPALNLPLASSLQCLHGTSELGKPLADFIGMKEYLTYCSLHDTTVMLPQGYNGKVQVSVWTKAGRECIDAERYMDIMETFQPDIYQALCDGDTDKSSSKKRVQRSMDNSYDFFQICLKRHKNSKSLQHSSLLAAVQGGYSITARGSSARMLAKVPVQGFVIDGLCANGPSGELLSMDEIKPLVAESLKYLPTESLRLAPGCWTPEAVWQLVQLGVDVFDSSLPTVVTDRGCAFTFQFKPDTGSFCYENPVPRNTSDLPSSIPDIKSSKDEYEKKEPMNYEISLKNPFYRDRLEPLLEGCECIACKNHTKAYVHHLLITQELLGPVLLMMHNLHHYFEFFKKIRQAVANKASKSDT